MATPVNIALNAEIHFHQQEQLSVFVESAVSDELEEVGEIGLVTAFTLRTFSNLDVCTESDNLARLLQHAEDMAVAFATRQATGGFELIPYPGHAGRKIFGITFAMAGQQVQFQMDPRGFDDRGTGFGYYAPIAILGLMRHLAIKRAQNSRYLQRIGRALSMCSDAYVERGIGLTNHPELTTTFLRRTCGDLPHHDASTQPGRELADIADVLETDDTAAVRSVNDESTAQQADQCDERPLQSKMAANCIEDLYGFRNLITTSEEIRTEVKLMGLTLADLEANPDSLFELGVARNFRRACEALNIPITPHQSLKLAKHLRVGGEKYRNGVPLNDQERSIAVRLVRAWIQQKFRESGETFTEEHERDCHRMVQFGERGLTIRAIAPHWVICETEAVARRW